VKLWCAVRGQVFAVGARGRQHGGTR
jgi:hypothetical protein